MQATVSAFDHSSRSGTVLLDDGVEVRFTESAIADSGLRFLRPGQRVRLVTEGEGGALEINRLQIISLAD